MTRDDIIRMAREARLPYYFRTGEISNVTQLEHFAALVAAVEREECAKVCESKINAEYATGKVDHNEMGWTQACAFAIRLRERGE